MRMDRDDERRIATAIAAAEARTSGEIVCVLAAQASDYAVYPLAWASFAALATPWALVELTHLSVVRILAIQLLVFAAAVFVLTRPALRSLIVPRGVQRREAHRTAMTQFQVRNMGRTEARAGVLIFAALAERYIRIVADDGIAAKVAPQVWQAAVDALAAHLRDGRLADGFVAAVEHCGDVLAAQAPPRPGMRDALPNRIYFI